MAGFFDNFFSSPQSRANEDIYGDLNSLKTVGDVQNRFGLKRRKAADVSQTFDPARAGLATRQAQQNAAAAARMSGSNATPQTTFGSITSSFAPAWSDLEGKAAETGLNVERSDEQNIAQMFDRVNQEKQQAAQGLSKSSGLDDVLAVAGTAAKFFPPTAALANTVGAVSSIADKINPSQFTGQDYSKLFGMPSIVRGATSALKDIGSFISPQSSTVGTPSPEATAMPEATTEDGQWGMSKVHGYNKKTNTYGWWNPNNPDVNYQQ